jgi:hypothetical protein
MTQHTHLMKATALASVGLLCLSACTTSNESFETVSYAADYPVFDSVEDLTESADLVITGTVIDSETRLLYPEISDSTDPLVNPWAGASQEEMEEQRIEGAVVTTVSTVQVEAVIKGDAQVGDTIEVSQLGGTVQEKVNGRTKQTTYVAQDTTLLDDVSSDTVLLMLNEHDQDPYDLLNPVQALYEVDADQSVEAVSSDPAAFDVSSLDEIESVTR